MAALAGKLSPNNCARSSVIRVVSSIDEEHCHRNDIRQLAPVVCTENLIRID